MKRDGKIFWTAIRIIRITFNDNIGGMLACRTASEKIRTRIKRKTFIYFIQSIHSVRKDAAGLILISCLVPAEPRALRRDHRFRQERPASLGREPEPGMLGHEKSADRPALIISFDW